MNTIRNQVRKTLLGLLAPLLLVACDPSADGGLGGALDEPLALPPAELSGVVFESYAEDTRDLVIAASTAVVDSAAKVARLQRVRISFAGEERGPTRITAPVAEFSLDSDDFVLRGGVRGSTQDGDRFQTDEVRYDHASRTLRASSAVRVDRSNLQLQGEGMELDVATRSLKLTGKVSARLDNGKER